MYFTKYLPVEGDVEFGDKYKLLGNRYDVFTSSEQNPGQGKGVLEKVKQQLFLCSEDIAIGDVAMEQLVNGTYDSFPIDTPNDIYADMIAKHTQFKVIGPVSCSAGWVKEGDEFREDQIIRHHICYDSPGNMGYCFHCQRSKGCDSEDYDYQIKGPCGHFH